MVKQLAQSANVTISNSVFSKFIFFLFSFFLFSIQIDAITINVGNIPFFRFVTHNATIFAKFSSEIPIVSGNFDKSMSVQNFAG